MKRTTHILLIAVALLALTSAPALAKKKTGGPTYVPPNQSAASQYTEDVPTAGGNTPSSGVGGSGGSGSSGGGSGSGSIPAKTLHQLDHSGSAGAAAASLAKSLSPTTAHTTASRSVTSKPSVAATPSSRTHSVTGASAASSTPKTQAGAPAAQVIKTLGGSDAGGGIGFLLPVILGLSLVVATGLGLMRIRRTA